MDDDASVTASDILGTRIVAALGEPAARELLDVLTRSDADRAALIGRLYAADARRVPGCIDIESDPDDITQMHLADGLRGALGAYSEAATHDANIRRSCDG